MEMCRKGGKWLMEDNLFTAISSEKIASLMNEASDRIIISTPALFIVTTRALIAAQERLGSESVTVVVDCDEEVFRLGYGDITALKLLQESGVKLRQCSGLRIGIFICDNQGWIFSPTALYVQPEVHSNETPNAIRISASEVENLVSRICPACLGSSQDDSEGLQVEIGISSLLDRDIQNTEENLKIAPPIAFDIARQVRVFQPYIQYVEISLKGCSIQRKRVQIPKSIQKLQAKDIEDRLQTTFDLIEKGSTVSSKKLEEELNQIRDNLTQSLGKPWGRVLLKSARSLFDKRMEEFQGHLEEHRKKVRGEIHEHLENSKDQVVDYYLPMFEKDPPDALMGQLLCSEPTQEDIRFWLRGELDRTFPKPEDLITDMRLDIQFRDVTYETLCQEGFFKALKKAYPRVNWEKPFDEFNAAKEKSDS
jgi:hypothetical protein